MCKGIRLFKNKKILGNKEFSISFILSIASSALGMLFSFLAAKFLQSSAYGEVNYYLSIVTILNTFMVFGVDNYLIKNIQFSESKKEEMGKAYLFVIALSTLLLPFYFRIASTYLTRFNGNTTLIMIVFVIAIFSSLCSITYAYFQAINKYQIKILFNGLIPHVIFLLIFFIHLATGSLGIFTKYYLLYYFASYCLIGIPLIVSLCRPFKHFYDFNTIKSITYMALAFILYNITIPISNVIIGETYKNFGIVGIFSISNQLLSISGLATTIISSISMPVYARIIKSKNMDDLYNYYQSFTRITIYISVPFYMAFIAESGNLMNFFGESYGGYNLILILLSVAQIIEHITGPCGNVLLMGNKEKENFVVSIIRFVIFLVLTGALIRITPYAAPIASITSAVISNSLKLYFANKLSGKQLFGMKIIPMFLAVSGISGTVFFGVSFINNVYFWLVLNIVVGGGLIISFIVFTPYKQDKKFFTTGKNQIVSK